MVHICLQTAFSSYFCIMLTSPKHLFLTAALALSCGTAARSQDSLKAVHRIAVDAVSANILHTNDFLRGGNGESRTMNHDFTVTAKYAFMNRSEVQPQSVHYGVYQGVGVARHDFNHYLGSPVSVYLFQGAPIARLSRRLTLNYEWNFGLAMGWNAYNAETNPDNLVIGSKATAYIDLDIYLRYILSRCFDINAGVSASHFSNGNTEYPNSGLNTAGVRIGLACYFNRTEPQCRRLPRRQPGFRHRFFADVIAYGAWKRQGYYVGDEAYLLPGRFAVMGINVNALYTLNPWIAVGPSLDAVYDRSANLDVYAYGSGDEAEAVGKFSRQAAVGLSARAEFSMPYFSINFGVGTNVIGAHGDLSGIYEVLALKIHVNRHAMLHIGYSLNDFKTPRHLMLGVGWRI